MVMVFAMIWSGAAIAASATKEEIDAAIKIYDGFRSDSVKQKAYCEVMPYTGEAAKSMSEKPKFDEANKKATAAINKLGPDFNKAHGLAPRLDMGSEPSKRYVSAKQALEKTCP